LGGTAFITDIYGSLVTRINYKPYGEIVTPIEEEKDIFSYKFTSQVDDGVATGLMYFKSRFYDPTIGRFLTADTVVPDPYNSQAFNRYMYVAGNPISYVDPTGNSWSWSGFLNGVKHVAIVALKIGTVVVCVVGMIALAPCFVSTLALVLTSIVVASIVINTILTLIFNIYSDDWRGLAAWVLDSTIGWPLVLEGQIFMIYLLIRGADFRGNLSEHSNSFIFDKVDLGSGTLGAAVGNVAAMNTDAIQSYCNKYGKDYEEQYYTTLREELGHGWQYRFGGIFAYIKLIQEQIFKACGIYDPYTTKWNLEYIAKTKSEKGPNDKDRPWYLKGKKFDKFYPGYERPKN
jgi:RHS repeat-associated protein